MLLQPALRRAQEVPNSPALDAAIKLLREVVPIEPQTTQALSDVASTNGGQLLGLQYRVKNLDSLARKIEPDLTIIPNDALRYIMSFNETNFTIGVASAMENLQAQGYQQIALRNSFKSGQPYPGINTNYLTPEGQVFELQFHTPSSFYMKDAINHHLYEQQRLLPDLHPQREILREQMIQNSAAVPIPPGVSTIKKAR